MWLTFSNMPDLNNDRSISAIVTYPADASLNVMSLICLRSVLTWWNNSYYVTAHCTGCIYTCNKTKSAWKLLMLYTKTVCLGLYCSNYLIEKLCFYDYPVMCINPTFMTMQFTNEP